MFTNDTDSTEGRISVKFYLNESCFHQIHARCYDTEGNVNYSTPVDVLVDADGPLNDCYEYIGCTYIKELTAGGFIRYISENTTKQICAFDTGCTGGVAGVCRIDWRVEDKMSMPIAEGTVYDNASEAVYYYTNGNVIVSGDLDPDVGEMLIEIRITEDCEHYIYHQAIDCLENKEPGMKQYNRVDTKPPRIVKTHPEHGYDPINDTAGYLKAGETITIEAFDDLSPNPCNSGLQYMFFRYTWDDGIYPDAGDIGPYTVVSGAEIVATYGYTEPEIIDYWWYRIDGDHVDLTWFDECRHDLYYWAKDNVCHHTDVHHQTYFVDEICPDISLELPDHGYVPIDDDSGYLKAYEPFYMNATDIAMKNAKQV